MPLPLPLLHPPSGWEMFLRRAEAAPVTDFPATIHAANGWAFPVELLTPLAALFDDLKIEHPGEGFLAGLQGASLLAARMLPATSRRHMPLAGIAVSLHNPGPRLFDDLRGGCWVPGFPAIGRGKELLRAARLADGQSMATTLSELGLQTPPGAKLYFNFPHSEPAADCERVYVLDDTARRLHGFALPSSASSDFGS